MSYKQLVSKLKTHYTLIFVVCISLLAYSQFEHSNKAINFFVKDSLYQSNQTYLSNLEKASVDNFVRLSTINATLSTMKSGVVGFSFIVETKLTIGEELKQFERLSEKGVKYSSLVTFSSVAISYVSSVAKSLSVPLFFILLVIGGVYGLVGMLEIKFLIAKLFSILRPVLVLFIAFHLVIPYAIHGSDYLSQIIEKEANSQNNDYFERVHQEIAKTGGGANIKQRANSIMGKVEGVLVDIERKIETLLLNCIEYLISQLLITIVIPLLLALFLMVGFRRFINNYIVHPLELEARRLAS
ncbi:MAG: hypothetical protein OQJ89_10700 [Kangiellaceae bacterium]|nr:hypothetical protein [Kangiellaceae bacterium]MCW9017425.1 hypothetical protein [Kangiellaceae bacterium]